MHLNQEKELNLFCILKYFYYICIIKLKNPLHYMSDIEYGKCPLCGKESNLQRTYFYYSIKGCECCGCNKGHFEMIRHCNKCIPSIPKIIHPIFKSLDGKNYISTINDILPIHIEGEFIITEKIIDDDKIYKSL